jgi:colicin import membrane protein
VLCLGHGCYISTGSQRSADYLRRVVALGPGNTLGRRAGACRNKLSCIYRNVDLAASAAMQPVSMGFWHHDRREVRSVTPDRTCEIVDGQLHCAKPVVASGYRAWIVPEVVAERAGPDLLEDALDNGLRDDEGPASADAWWSAVQDDPTR